MEDSLSEVFCHPNPKNKKTWNIFMYNVTMKKTWCFI